MTYNIGIDIRMIGHTGIGTYIRGLLGSLLESQALSESDLCFFAGNNKEETFSRISHIPFRSRIYTIEEQFEYPFHLRHCRLWHAPHYNAPIFKGRTKLVVTIHDLIHWIFRKEFFTPLQTLYAQQMLQRVVQIADHIITVSHKTRQDLMEYFEVEPEKVSVVYEGVLEAFRPLLDEERIESVRHRLDLPQNFFLYVGSLKPHKNILWLIHLYRKLKNEKKIDAALVLIGKKDRRYPSGYKELSRLENGSQGIFHLPYVEKDDLISLYNGALALIHPSLYEGFGLTLLEAMACGTPVIACRSASIPEVVGEEAAYLVDPCAEREMMEAMVRMEKFPSVRDSFRRKGFERVRLFSWEAAARRTAEIYERVLSAS